VGEVLFPPVVNGLGSEAFSVWTMRPEHEGEEFRFRPFVNGLHNEAFLFVSLRFMTVSLSKFSLYSALTVARPNTHPY